MIRISEFFLLYVCQYTCIISLHIGKDRTITILYIKNRRRTMSRVQINASSDPYQATENTGTLKFYGQSTSRVCKVLWCAAEAGVINIERAEIPLPKLQAEEWYYKLNPKLTVPTMRDGPLVLNESNTIVQYISSTYSKGKLYPDNSADVALCMQWLEYGETTIASSQTPVWFGVTKDINHKTKKSPADMDFVRGYDLPKSIKAWKGFEQHMSDGRSYVMGNKFCMADFTIGIQANRLKKCDGFGFDELKLKNFPYTSFWLDRLEARPAFQKYVLPFGA